MSLWPKAQVTRCPKNLLLFGRRAAVPSVLRKAQGSRGTELSLALDQAKPGGELASGWDPAAAETFKCTPLAV